MGENPRCGSFGVHDATGLRSVAFNQIILRDAFGWMREFKRAEKTQTTRQCEANSCSPALRPAFGDGAAGCG
jgi:hypothetical protein